MSADDVLAADFSDLMGTGLAIEFFKTSCKFGLELDDGVDLERQGSTAVVLELLRVLLREDEAVDSREPGSEEVLCVDNAGEVEADERALGVLGRGFSACFEETGV